jgi:ATP-binding cassette, subfamily B, bacterial CvaB/MchF/RaxB
MPRSVPVVLQAVPDECGLASLVMVARSFGRDCDVATLRRRYAALDSGPSLKTILQVADALGLVGRPVRLGIDELRRLALPAILHWEFDHFVVLTKLRRRSLVIHDPAVGRRCVGRDTFADAFTGVAIEFSPAGVWPASPGRRNSLLRGLLRSFRGLGRFLAVMLVLLFTSQLLSLAPPIATQLLIDDVVLGHDRAWLYRVLAGVALILIAMLLIESARRWIALYTGTRLATESTTAVVRHVLRLPVAAVEPRPVGDLMSRIESLRPIRAAMTETCLTVIVQFAVLATTLAVMTYYSPLLTLIPAGALVLTLTLHGGFLPAMRSVNLESVVASARASNSLIESLRGFRIVHALGLDMLRLAHWQRFFVTATNATARRQRLDIGFSFGQGLIAAAEQLLFLAIGVGGVIDRRHTLGVLFAFVALRGRLAGSVAQLVAATRELFLLRSHVERAGELVAEPAEPEAPAAAMREAVTGEIECRDLRFAYPGRPDVLAGISSRIEAGETVVIRGRSGAGKTTLLRLLAADLTARSGSVLYDGISTELWDARALKRQFGVVLQQDCLFAGTLADNVSCFEPVPDVGRIREAARLAAIWNDVDALPMKLATRVCDGGAGLSGGQIQRLVLARALYRQPRVLFLDEATNQLDAETERQVLANLRSLGITIVSVAHGDYVAGGGWRRIRLDGPCGTTRGNCNATLP